MEETKNDVPIRVLLAQKGIRNIYDWGNLTDKEQIENGRIFHFLMDLCIEKNNISKLSELWQLTKPKAQLSFEQDFYVFLEKTVSSPKGSFDFAMLMSATAPELKEKMNNETTWNKIINIIKENTTMLSVSFEEKLEAELNGESVNNYYIIIAELIKSMPKELQLQKREFIIDILGQAKDTEYITTLWGGIKCKQELWNDVYDITKSRNMDFKLLFEGTPYNLQKEKLEDFSKIFEDSPMLVWQSLKPQLQMEYWDEYKEKFKGNIEELATFFSESKPEVLKQHKDYINELFIENKSNIENVITLWRGMRGIKELQAENFKQVMELTENDKENLIKLWDSTSPAVQRENLDEVFTKYKDDEKLFQTLWAATSSQDVFLDKMMNLCGNDLKKQVELWKNMLEIFKNRQNFKKIYDNVKNNGDLLVSMWSSTPFELQKSNEKIISEIIEGSKNNPANSSLILNNTLKSLLTKDDIQKLLQIAVGENQNIEEAMDVYNKIETINPDIYKTINLQMLSQKYLEIFDIKKLVSLSVDIGIQEKITRHGNQPICLDVIKYIESKGKNWIIELNDILSKMDNYESLLVNINQEKLNDEDIEQLISCLSGSVNFFNIESIDQVKNFYNIRKDICSQILEGKDVSSIMSKEFREYSSKEKKIFAMLELTYGIDFEEAKNIIYKYGTDIDKIVPKDGIEENLTNTIKAIKIILNLKEEEVDAIYKENKEKIQNWKDIKYSSISTIEAESMQLYTRIYDEANKFQERELQSTEYKGKEVKVSEIEGDFFANIRVEGAYSFWKEPEDYNKYMENVYPKINGNCTSVVASNLFARAKPKGPTFVYDNNKEFPLELLAPWDIASSSANETFSPASVKYNYRNGIQFRIPEEEINNTRHGHNEAVKRKWHYDEGKGKMVKEKPSRVLYVQENINQTEEEREKDRQWKMAKKAAAQLGINITILNLEKNLQNQEQKIEALENALLNKEENKENLTEEKIIEKLIVEFENNRVTMRYVNNNLKEKYFTDEKRDKLYNLIENKIKTLKNSNPQEAEKLMESYIGVLQNEFNKAYTITGNAVNGLQDFEYIKNRLNAQNVQEASNEEIQNKKLQDIYKRYNINLSDIEFVNKMIENKTQNMDEVRE